MSVAPGAATLAAAAQAVAAVRWQGRSADDALAPFEPQPDRAAVRAIALGTMRWLLRLEPALAPLLARPLAQSPPALAALLVTAAHQVVYSRGAPEVSVHLAVDAARVLGQQRSSGFVNAVLRRFVRERDERLAAVDAERAARTAHPLWLEQAIATAWPEDSDAVLAANNAHPPMTLRVDLARTSTADYLRELAAAGRAAQAHDWRPGAVGLAAAVNVSALPGFREGRGAAA
jgi:16S rRNA (cytosine967-C5)-methyltransferase